MRTLVFAKRNAREILLDPLSISLGLGFPIVMLLLLSFINNAIPVEVDMFKIERLAPGIAVFGYTFLTLFIALLISQDRCGAFLTRLYSSTMKSVEFIIGYIIPMLPIALLQTVICFGAGLFFGLDMSVRLILAALILQVSALFYISLGVLFGALLNDKAVGGIGSIVINVATLSAGVWFPLEDMKGTAFYDICTNMPFYHTVKLGSAVLTGEYELLPKSVVFVGTSAIAATMLAAIVFSRKMSADNA